MKKIIISGSSSGIGLAITQQLLSEGHQVIGLSRSEQCVPKNKNYSHYNVDFKAMNSLSENLKKIANQHSDIEVIISSAGYGHFAELEQFSIKQMQDIMQVNFLSQAVLVKTFLPYFKKAQKGKMIMLGSEAGLNGAKKSTLYSASKFALRGFCESLRKECTSSGIAITVINPGLVNTDFFESLNFEPKNRDQIIQPEQIAKVVSQLIQMENYCVVEEINIQPQCKNIIRKRDRLD